MINLSGSILTNQGCDFWTNQTVRFWSLHLYEDSKVKHQGQGLLSIISQLGSDLGSALSVFVEESIFLSGALTLKLSEQSEAKWSGAVCPEKGCATKPDQRRVELSCHCGVNWSLAPGLPQCYAVLQPCCIMIEVEYSCAVSQLSCFH